MYINEHQPPHFHVHYQGYKATVNIKDGTVTGCMPRRALRLVYEWLDEHTGELLDNWERLSRYETPQTIEPLN